MLTPDAPNQSVALEFQENQLKELARHMLALRDLRNLRRLARRPVSKVEQRVQRVFGFLGEHDYSINPIDIIGLPLHVKPGNVV
jgi:hypothetical protein